MKLYKFWVSDEEDYLWVLAYTAVQAVLLVCENNGWELYELSEEDDVCEASIEDIKRVRSYLHMDIEEYLKDKKTPQII